MRNRLLLPVLTLTLTAGAAAAGTLLVQKTVLVTVVATPASPVKGLASGDFTIHEEKTNLEVTGAEPATDPLFVTLVVDVTTPIGVNPPTQELRRSLKSFFAAIRAEAPDAQFSLFQVANAATPLTGFTSDPVKLDDAVGHLVAGALSGSVMLEGVSTAAKAISDEPSPRRAVICVSFGSAEAGSDRPSKIADEVTKSGMTLWAISVQGTGDTQAAAREEVWSKLTVASGGMFVPLVGVTGLENQLKLIANSLLSQYSVSFARKSDGGFKPLTGETSKGNKVLFSRWMR